MTSRPLSSRRTLAINTASSVTTRLLQLTVLVWVNQYLLRHVETAEYALMPLVLSLLVFGEIFRTVFTGGLGRFIVEADARSDDAGVTRVVSSMMPALVAGAGLLLLATAAAAWQMERLLGLETAHAGLARLMLLLLMGTLCLDLVTSPFSQGLYVRQRFMMLNGIELAGEALRAGLVCALLLGVHPTVLWLAVGSATASVLTLVCRIVLTRRLVPAIRWRVREFHAPTARRLLGFGAWTSVHGLANLVATAAPALLLNRAASPLHVAAFHLGRLPDLQLRRLAAAAAVPMQPALTSLQAVRGEESLHELYYRGGRYHLWIILLAAAPLAVFAVPLMRLYAGETYTLAAYVLIPLVAVYPFSWASAMFYRIAHAVGRVGAYYSCDLVVQLVTLGALAYAVLAAGWGAAGAAAAMAAANGAMHVLLVWPLGLRLVRGSWRRFWRQTLWPGLLPCAGAVAAAGAFHLWRPVQTWTDIGLGTGLATAVYLTLLFGCCLDAVDRELVQRVLRRRRRTAATSTRVGWRGQTP
jgi:O-antigen/teichoic acid export membrane protein